MTKTRINIRLDQDLAKQAGILMTGSKIKQPMAVAIGCFNEALTLKMT